MIFSEFVKLAFIYSIQAYWLQLNFNRTAVVQKLIVYFEEDTQMADAAHSLTLFPSEQSVFQKNVLFTATDCTN